jgi:uncharacterized protein YdaL
MGGVIAEWFNFTAAFWLTAAVNAVGVALFFIATRMFFERRRLDVQA